jgi:DNA repair protein RadA/Sms
MTKVKTVFFCSNCGAESPKWIGKCTSCSEWNTFVEEVIHKGPVTGAKLSNKSPSAPKSLSEINVDSLQRYQLPDAELNRVLGGGLVPGSIILVGGEPGIGKSTLMLQIATQSQLGTVVYISGEESEQQIRLRADRVGTTNTECLIHTETSTQEIIRHLKKVKPAFVIVDSIQTMYSPFIDSTPGSVSQIRECANDFIRYGKENQVPFFLIGHITKEGALAGPKVLEHMVDTVLLFEGDRNHLYRLLRTTKNRFGATHELGIYEMASSGLRIVENPSQVLLGSSDEALSGTAIAATMEGMRPMLIEIQSLVSTAVYGTPQRSATGFDLRRMNMLLAVLEKRCGFRLGMKDVFLNMAGGIRVDDPASDLAIVSAILSSNEDMPIDKSIAFAAEVGLSGEIRPVTRVDQRISEAEKLGFTKIFVSKFNKDLNHRGTIEVVQVKKVDEVFAKLFG